MKNVTKIRLACGLLLPLLSSVSVAAEVNTSTASGLTSVRSTTVGSTSSEGGGLNAGSTGYYDGIVENKDLTEAVEGCPIADAQLDAITQKSNLYKSATPDTDKTFNAQSEASAGCFNSSKQILNLAASIPRISTSWSDIGANIAAAVQQKIDEQVNNYLNQACQIADQALLNAYAPLNNYISELNANSEELNSMFGDIISFTGEDGNALEGLNSHFNSVTSELETSINNASANVVHATTSSTGSITEIAGDSFGLTNTNQSSSTTTQNTATNTNPTSSAAIASSKASNPSTPSATSSTSKSSTGLVVGLDEGL